MDDDNQPVTALLRGTLLTPQGLILVVFSLLYLTLGLVSFFADVQLFMGLSTSICFVWSLILIVRFICYVGPSFESNVPEIISWFIYAVAPLIFWLIDNYS